MQFLHLKSFIEKIEDRTIKITALGSTPFPDDGGLKLIRKNIPILHYLDEMLELVRKLTDVISWKIREI